MFDGKHGLILSYFGSLFVTLKLHYQHLKMKPHPEWSIFFKYLPCFENLDLHIVQWVLPLCMLHHPKYRPGVEMFSVFCSNVNAVVFKILRAPTGGSMLGKFSSNSAFLALFSVEIFIVAQGRKVVCNVVHHTRVFCDGQDNSINNQQHEHHQSHPQSNHE